MQGKARVRTCGLKGGYSQRLRKKEKVVRATGRNVEPSAEKGKKLGIAQAGAGDKGIYEGTYWPYVTWHVAYFLRPSTHSRFQCDHRSHGRPRRSFPHDLPKNASTQIRIRGQDRPPRAPRPAPDMEREPNKCGSGFREMLALV